MEGKRYPSDLTDDEWVILESLIPSAKPGGRPRSADLREAFPGASCLRNSRPGSPPITTSAFVDWTVKFNFRSEQYG
jgi:transposase